MNFIQEKLAKMRISRKIALSFVVVILMGAFLLTLPISNRGWTWLNPLDALFTATSATCVTGLVTKVTADQFTMFGQLVILLMIQIGGLGLMTIVAIFIIHLKSRLSLNDRLMMKEMLNQDSLSDMHNFIRSILRYTLIFEGCGAAFCWPFASFRNMRLNMELSEGYSTRFLFPFRHSVTLVLIP